MDKHEIRQATVVVSNQQREKLMQWVMAVDVKELPVEIWHLCFEFLHLSDVLHCEMVNRDWNMIARDEIVWQRLYCRDWRRNVPFPCVPITIATSEFKAMCLNRRDCSRNHSLSTRSKRWVRSNGHHVAHNDSLLRDFHGGAIESVRTYDQLFPLTCATALGQSTMYYEVAIRGGASVGVASVENIAQAEMYGHGSNSHVGWSPVSYGFHSDDGRIYYNDGSTPFGGHCIDFDKPWGESENYLRSQPRQATIIGCGYDYDRNILFFTKNGKFIKELPVVSTCYSAAVSLHQLGDSAEFNFGTTPFAFDFESYCVQ